MKKSLLLRLFNFIFDNNIISSEILKTDRFLIVNYLSRQEMYIFN
jgi:hypothetical protein